MKHEVTKNKVISALGWKMSERLSTQMIQFALQIVLARLLSPSDYGTVGLITIYITISTVIVQGGFSDALIRKIDIDEVDLSSVFYIYMGFSSVFYVFLFLLAPYIASFYGKPILVPVLRVLGLNLFPASFNAIQQAMIARSLRFKAFFMRTTVALLISGTGGLIMAFLGFGVWALVVMQMLNAFTSAFVMWFTIKWQPKWVFSFSRAKELYAYGYKLMLSNLITTLYNSLYGLIIGKVYDISTLGYYTRGQQFPVLIAASVEGTVASVMFPTLSSMQGDPKRLKETMRRAISSSSFLLSPLMIGLAVVAEPLIRILLGEKWMPCVPYLQLTSFAYLFWPMQGSNLAGLQAIGRSDLILKLGIVKRVVGVSLLGISLLIGPKLGLRPGIESGALAMMGANVITQIFGCFVHAGPNKKLLNYGVGTQVRDILPYLGISGVMAGAIYPLKYVLSNPFLLIAIQILTGALVYFLIAKLFKMQALNDFMAIAKEFSSRVKAKRRRV
jgi:teichuronic acid exporter